MKTALLAFCAFTMMTTVVNAEVFACKSNKRKPVTCEKVEGAKRTHLCVKKNVKINPEIVKKYCLKEKAAGKTAKAKKKLNKTKKKRS